MYAKHPSIAKEFEAATPKGADLPEHVKKKHEAMKSILEKRKGGS